jgi:hypothetical protein
VQPEQKDRIIPTRKRKTVSLRKSMNTPGLESMNTPGLGIVAGAVFAEVQSLFRGYSRCDSAGWKCFCTHHKAILRQDMPGLRVRPRPEHMQY